MFPGKNDRPYFDAWLRRTGRQFAVSGRLTETAMALAKSEGGTVDEWRARLRIILEGNEVPSLDLLMLIDKLLARTSKNKPAGDSQDLLF
ncbi:hypothetical protein JIN84_16135 [Luteolibacter yonseiensis]|uniref:Uncharacterized protein n=1 Tax=Luteolibacter yonseiensis TaxID=1144680 RepID=A0A934R8G6_9BACT|nr:hypothetical protein [Luteolibacter yonseiensis]MBK1817150.1 hypothetical protein [Luteolibacter yonseiensis]